jgi:hypothetical protein
MADRRIEEIEVELPATPVPCPLTASAPPPVLAQYPPEK